VAATHISPGLGIQFREIEKRYGALRALRGVSLRVASGEFVALLGHNGSGKTTLLRIAAQLVRPSRGTLDYSSGDSQMTPDAARRRVGVVAHQTMVYDELTAEENLSFFGKLYGLDGLSSRTHAALESSGLASRARDLVRTFSRGMRQRLAIARALLPEPQLLLLDEPATGLDAEGQRWLAETLQRLNEGGCTILMSTHDQGGMHASVTRAIRLNRGEVMEDSRTGAGSLRTRAEAQ
jgi:heme exporter protein A